ncbi:MAG: 1,2-epoxyphenylacetyl-CoA isomerase [Anaerolineales bacterium]|jgi:2-(1,2-epoxy-1,2-dihydrophenyl)acetyl-CoA isomerase|nr:1,2-epoxyphenylacetyl-CoA isomerase [Anaerolineales bacterium]MDX9936644.1 enoyl-CoA hydratase-related protein [Anaerolineales bacterium]GER78169.1 2-(1,2-epoxy-1,2-dihydrophenyl)acetyl-CoA isomerase [Candidatus Denitrolinea symbiosum]
MTTLLSTLQAGVRTLTFNRPERANALDFDLIQSLRRALDEAERDPATRVLVLTGAGTAFGAGQDIAEMRAGAGKVSYRQHLQQTYNPLVLKIRQIEKPVIAAVNGMCAGASLGIALACDLRVAAAEAKFVVGFGGIGLVPDSGVSLFLPALIGLGRAAEFYFSNQPIDAQTALQWGLVNRVIPSDLTGAAQNIAAMLALGPVGAYGKTKLAFNKAMYPHLEEVLATEADLQEDAGKTKEHQEGVNAFLEKRIPNFR